MSEPTDTKETEIDFLEAFFIEYDPLKNMIKTAFGQMDSTGKQYSGDLVVKAAAAKMPSIRQQVLLNARGRILLVNGSASLAATQTITGAVAGVVSALAVRDPRMPSEQGKEAYLVSLVISTDQYSIGQVLQIDAPEPDAAQ